MLERIALAITRRFSPTNYCDRYALTINNADPMLRNPSITGGTLFRISSRPSSSSRITKQPRAKIRVSPSETRHRYPIRVTLRASRSLPSISTRELRSNLPSLFHSSELRSEFTLSATNDCPVKITLINVIYICIVERQSWTATDCRIPLRISRERTRVPPPILRRGKSRKEGSRNCAMI